MSKVRHPVRARSKTSIDPASFVVVFRFFPVPTSLGAVHCATVFTHLPVYPDKPGEPGGDG
jgi:hypothetical protein